MSSVLFDAYFPPEVLDEIKREEGVDPYHARINGAHIRSVYQNIPTSLDLFFHKFGNYFTILLADALCENDSVETLGLEMNQISDKGAKALAWALSINRSILRVDLSNNHLGAEGVLAMARGPMRQNPSIVSWNLTNNMNRACNESFEVVDKAYCEVVEMLRLSKSVLEYHGPYQQFLQPTFVANRMRAELLTDVILHAPDAMSGDQFDDLQDAYGAVIYILRESGFNRASIVKIFSRLEKQAALYHRRVIQPVMSEIRATSHFLPGKHTMTVMMPPATEEAKPSDQDNLQEKAFP